MFNSPARDRAAHPWLPTLLLLALGSPVRAQDDTTTQAIPDEGSESDVDTSIDSPSTTASEGDASIDSPSTTASDGDAVSSEAEPGETITVYGEAEVKRRRAVLENLIVDQGYKEGKRRGNRTVFRPEIPWKPSVVVYDEGFTELKRSPVRWMHPGKQDNPLNNLWCIPPFTPMCVRIGGQVVSAAKLTPQKTKVLDEVHDQTESWRQAIVDQATWTRVNEEVPALVQATWETGAPLEADGPSLGDHAERRKALLDFWASRSDTREGDMVAQVVADFIAAEVQSSPWPVTADELADANAAASGKRTLHLGLATEPKSSATPAPAPPAPPG